MLSDEEIKTLLTDIEADNVERTVSTNDTAKFCEAICAFANDLPNHEKPGYLLIGAEDETVHSLFHDYRTAAVDPEIIEENNRDTFQQMAALGLWDEQNQCVTNAGALLFSEAPQDWLPGSYIQYVRYDGTDLESDILDERRFTGDLPTSLRTLDAFVQTLFVKVLEANP